MSESLIYSKAEVEAEEVKRAAAALPDFHEGYPPHTRIRMNMELVQSTVKAYQIRVRSVMGGNPAAWVPRSQVGKSESMIGGYNCYRFWIPLWLYRKIRPQLMRPAATAAEVLASDEHDRMCETDSELARAGSREAARAR